MAKRRSAGVSVIAYLLLFGGLSLALGAAVAPIPQGYAYRFSFFQVQPVTLRFLLFFTGLICSGLGWALAQRLWVAFALVCVGSAFTLAHSLWDISLVNFFSAMIDAAVLAWLVAARDEFTVETWAGAFLARKVLGREEEPPPNAQPSRRMHRRSLPKIKAHECGRLLRDYDAAHGVDHASTSPRLFQRAVGA